MASNELRMPFAEWYFRLCESDVPYQARGLAVSAVLYKVSSNEELAKLSGMDTRGIADKTYNKWKKALSDHGWVNVKVATIGRLTTIEISPAIGWTPVTFTDIRMRDWRKIPPLGPVKVTRESYGATVEPTRESYGQPVEVTDEARISYGPTVEVTAVSCAPARGVVNNIYNKNNNLLPSHSLTTVELDAAREGETGIGNGVFVNCETVRHANFEISLKAIQLQLCGAVPMETIKSVAQGHALQWAVDIAAGKSPTKVVPSNVASFIRASIQRQANDTAVTDVRKKRMAGTGTSNRMSLEELSANVDAAYERQFPQPKSVRLTHER